MMSRFIFFMVIVLLGCQEYKVISRGDLKKYITDVENGLYQKITRNGVDIEVFYYPSVLLSAQQIDGLDDAREKKRVIQGFDSLTYFVLRLSQEAPGIESTLPSDKNELLSSALSYQSSSIGSSIYLTTPKGTVNAMDVVFTQIPGSSAPPSLMAVFDEDVKTLTGTISFHFDGAVLGLGSSQFAFNSADIKKAPTLNIN